MALMKASAVRCGSPFMSGKVYLLTISRLLHGRSHASRKPRIKLSILRAPANPIPAPRPRLDVDAWVAETQPAFAVALISRNGLDLGKTFLVSCISTPWPRRVIDVLESWSADETPLEDQQLFALTLKFKILC